MHVLLIAVHPSVSPQSVPLANAYLQQYQRQSADEGSAVGVTRLDFFLADPPESAAELIRIQHPQAVGFSIYTWNRRYCLTVAALLRQQQPDLTIFAGGPEVTADAEGILREGNFDFLICGEGELPFAQVCRQMANHQPVAGVAGVATLDQAGEFRLAPASPLADLDQIPSPWLAGALDCRDYSGILWQLSRGCSFTCDFCFDSRGIHGVRRFSLERIEAELRHFAGNQVSQFFVLDSTFNQDLKRAKAVLRLIRKHAPQTHFHFEVRSEFIDQELAELFSQLTCSLQIGLQSANREVLQGVGRNFQRQDFEKRVMLLNQSGATFGFDLIFGLPGDTLQSFRASLDFALGLYPNHLDIFPLAILPGTALAARRSALGMQHLPVPPYTVTTTPTMSGDDFVCAQKLAVACDIFYTRGKAVAWFLGVLEPLNMTPASFLESFAQWLTATHGTVTGETECGDREIWQMQRSFLSTLYGSSKRLQQLLPTVLDLVDYHYLYAACVTTPPATSATGKVTARNLLQRRFCRSSSLQLASFHHEILDLLDTVVDVRLLAKRYPRNGSFAAIYTSQTGVMTESLDEVYFRLLESLDGSATVATLLKRLRLSPEDIIDFMQFAVEEGIIVDAEV